MKSTAKLVASVLRAVTWARYGRKYRSPIRPDRLLWIDPHRVNYKLLKKPQTRWLPPTRIVSEEWDRDRESLEYDVVFESFYQHFVEDKAWEETEYVDFLSGNVSEHGGLSTEEALDRCRRMDRLYEYIETYGYICQEELEREGELLFGLSHSWLPPAYREITVNIGQDGEFIWQAGMHRLVIAQLVDVAAIPVRVYIRHSQWQDTRERVYSKGEIRRHSGHPDLEYLL